ncbi:SDR family oxidoreductase [Devosia naphthalenivorans]|uniref:SDR family oxidoreductase n=1 Tax=Devosia naphthalenivorans TaxID=2082392 RepID=UPI000D3CD4C7|nr:SDR family oxidoreductase [Devosia naphthalenivorans]
MSFIRPIKSALVVGSNGIVGRNLVEKVLQRGGVGVTVLARGHANVQPGVQTVTVDLESATESRAALAGIGSIDTVFFTALAVRPTPQEQIQPNLQLLENSVGPLLERSSGTHVCVVQGTKWYGSHRGPYKTPARETDARDMVENFYHVQHDWLSAKARETGNSWSTARPHFIGGFNTGNPNNLIMALGVYAAIQKSAGEPLHFPGTVACFNSLSTMTNASLLADAMVWMATDRRCHFEDFNVTNGDYFRWCNLWPQLAEAFAMQVGEVRTVRLDETMADKSGVWSAITAESGLKPVPFDKLVSWSWADFMFRGDWDDMSDSTKARSLGFQQCRNTEQDILDLIEIYRRQRVLP